MKFTLGEKARHTRSHVNTIPSFIRTIPSALVFHQVMSGTAHTALIRDSWAVTTDWESTCFLQKHVTPDPEGTWRTVYTIVQ